MTATTCSHALRALAARALLLHSGRRPPAATTLCTIVVSSCQARGRCCSFSVNVTGTSPGTKTNTTTAVTSTEGGSGNTATATLSVIAVAPIPALSPLVQALLLVVLCLSALLFLQRRRALGR